MTACQSWSDWVEVRRSENPNNTADAQQKLRQSRLVEAVIACVEDSAPIQTCATDIGDTYQGHHTQPFNECNFVWCTIADACHYVDEVSAPRLADLFIAIKALPDLKNAAGYSTNIGGKFWRDTPNWGWLFDEHGMFFSGLEVHPEVDPRDADRAWREQGPGLLGATLFAANLYIRAESQAWMGGYADDAMVAGVERSYDKDHPDREAEREWEVWLPVSATWILIAGERLHGLCFGYLKDNDSRVKTWAKERWVVWKEKFGIMSEGVGIDGDERCMGYARKARERMEKIEHRWRQECVQS